jgi:hypothetical protein
MDVYSTELGIRLSFVKTSEFRGGNPLPPPPVCHCLGGLVEVNIMTVYVAILRIFTKFTQVRTLWYNLWAWAFQNFGLNLSNRQRDVLDS